VSLLEVLAARCCRESGPSVRLSTAHCEPDHSALRWRRHYACCKGRLARGNGNGATHVRSPDDSYHRRCRRGNAGAAVLSRGVIAVHWQLVERPAGDQLLTLPAGVGPEPSARGGRCPAAGRESSRPFLCATFGRSWQGGRGARSAPLYHRDGNSAGAKAPALLLTPINFMPMEPYRRSSVSHSARDQRAP
jgi:hypothetical protein